MNESTMVQTESNHENGLTTDHIQLELKPLIKNQSDSLKHQSSLELLVLSQNQEDVVVKHLDSKLKQKQFLFFIVL